MRRLFLAVSTFITVSMHSTRAFRMISNVSRPRKSKAGSSISSTIVGSPSLEVEIKFHLMDKDMNLVKRRIHELGFVPKGDPFQMIDWYFDSPDYSLVRQDCWLRFRQRRAVKNADDDQQEPQHGQWELKRGRRDTGWATVYEEIEGLAGFKAALDQLTSNRSLLSRDASLPNDLLSYKIPSLPEHDCNLLPFARIFTERTSYKSTNHGSQNLTIDLDTTDYGHAVGEVEAVVATEDELPEARRRIQELLKELLPDENNDILSGSPTAAAKGKLEVYIEARRPQLYKILVDAGVM